MGFQWKLSKGNVVLSDETAKAEIEALMHQAAIKGDRNEMEAMGLELVKPIQTIADYVEWGNRLLVPLNIAKTDDPKLPIEHYDIQAFYTASDGQILPTRVGYEYARFETFGVDCSFEILWDELETAPFDILGQKMKRAAEELARKRDSYVQTLLDAAANSLGDHNPSASTLTKSAVDAIFKDAAGIGLPIKTVVINPSNALDMRGWETSPAQLIWSDASRDKVMIDGFVANYGGADWYSLYTVPMDTVYFVADPAQVGYFINRGDLRSTSDIDIRKKINLYSYDIKFGAYVGNPYGVYALTIS